MKVEVFDSGMLSLSTICSDMIIGVRSNCCSEYSMPHELSESVHISNEADTFLQTLLETIPDILFVFDEECRYLCVLSSEHNINQMKATHFVGNRIHDLWPKELADRFYHTIRETLLTDQPQSLEYERDTTIGLRWFEGRTQPLPQSLYGCKAVVFLARDITERKLAEIARAKSDSQLNTLYELGIVGFAFSLTGKRWIRVNSYLCRLLEYSEAELLGMTWAEFTHPDDLRNNIAEYEAMLANQNNGYQLEKRYISKTGRVIPVRVVVGCSRRPDGSIDYVTTMIEDISERRKNEAEILQLAFYDSLTGLPNRRHFGNKLHHALTNDVGEKRYGALFFIDLDNFKTLNDTLGHEKGDGLLTLVASRLSGCITEPDLVARQGGDEFVVLLEAIADKQEEAVAHCQQVGDRLLEVLSQPYFIDGFEYNTTASIGITLFGSKPENNDELLKRADIAMYQAKALGRNTYCFFDSDMQDKVSHRAALSADLLIGIREEQFELYYQPQVLRSRKVIGAEALIRWQHPERGMVSPAAFIPLAEESGAILLLGHWVLKTACLQLAEWAEKSEYEHLTIAVNVSARQFHQYDFVDKVLQVLAETGANPARLKLELTESMLLQDIEDIITKMTILKQQGVGFSLDDFGTGYSSLSYLKRLPLDQLKIDQSFVRDLLTDANDDAIARTIVALAESMGLSVIAEGVETQEQCNCLARHGCLTYQGYLFGRPVPIDEFSLVCS
jgi:diguanylate cyclase (GGDEF)-like protein/PAS domain S-box-containing protein